MTRGGMVRLGAFVVVTVGMIVAAVLMFTDLHWWRRWDHYVVRVDRSVTGLGVGANVELWGIRVGSVDSIRIDRGHEPPIAVVLAIEPGTRIPVGAEARLKIEGLTGVKYIDLVGGDLTGPALQPGAEIPVGGHDLGETIERAGDVAAKLDDVMDQLQQVADNLEDLTGEENRRRVASILADVDAITGSAREAMTDVRGAASDVRVAAGDFRVTASHVADIVRREGRQVHALMSQLRMAAEQVRRLARTLEQDPSRLLRGRPPREREPP
ncbi:MAG TPA: MlaD family protein [Kofleriaceae bacterium]|nr:MlaD family protein [Kofleriaceae bacterium]